MPPQVFIVWRLRCPEGILTGSVENNHGLALFVVNGIWSAFDRLDTRRWIRDEDETPGPERA